MDWVIEVLGETNSTQDVVKARAGQGAFEGLAVQALTQSAGRGRHERSWISEPGDLYLSVLLRPPVETRHAGEIALLAAVAAAEAIRIHLNKPAALILKWPNDVLLDGKKCAGILIETALQGGRIEWVALGIGVNITNAPNDMSAYLNEFSHEIIDSECFRDYLLNRLGFHYDAWLKNGFAPLRKRWLENAHAQGARLTVKNGVRVEEGFFQTLDENGNLQMLDKDGHMKTITAGEVFL